MLFKFILKSTDPRPFKKATFKSHRDSATRYLCKIALRAIYLNYASALLQICTNTFCAFFSEELMRSFGFYFRVIFRRDRVVWLGVDARGGAIFFKKISKNRRPTPKFAFAILAIFLKNSL